jgi:hypothetical protein
VIQVVLVWGNYHAGIKSRLLVNLVALVPEDAAFPMLTAGGLNSTPVVPDQQMARSQNLDLSPLSHGPTTILHRRIALMGSSRFSGNLFRHLHRDPLDVK